MRINKSVLWLTLTAVAVGIPAARAQVTPSSAQPQNAPGFAIARDGKPEATIVVPAQTWPVESYAADELAAHIEKVTGVKLAIEKEGSAGDASARFRIYVGRTRAFSEAVGKKQISLKAWRALPFQVAAASAPAPADQLARPFTAFPPNGFIVRTVDNALYLAGRDDPGQPLNDTVSAGTLFAVYEWLEGQLGVRWIWPGDLGTRIPQTPVVTTGQWDRQAQPPLISTRMRRMIGTSVFTPGEGGYTPEQRKQVMQDEAIWYRRNRFARAVNLDYGGHAFEGYWKRFGETHPEYFNLLPDGKRRPVLNDRVISMSVADPGFHKQVVEDWKKLKTPERPWINAIENDTSGLCTCNLCMASDVRDPALGAEWDRRLDNARQAFAADERTWYRHLGSLSDRYARYYLEVQRLARESDPAATVIAYAYLNYRTPPLATKLNSNIVIGLIPEAPDPQSYLWPLNDSTYEGFKQQWTEWSKTGAMLYLRPNYLISGHEQPLLFPDQIARYFQLAYQNNLVATDYDSLTSMWATQGPNLYVATRLHWQPEWPVEKILDEYYSLFGPAAKEVRAYFTFWQGRTAARGEKLVRLTQGELKPYIRPLYLKWSEFYSVSSLVFTPEYYASGEKLLAAAKAAARGDEMAERRVDFLAAGLKDARLVAEAATLGLKLEQTGDLDAMSRAVAKLDAHRAWLAQTYPHALNFDLASFNENRTWDRLVYNALARGESSQKLPVQWSVRFDPERSGQREAWFNQPGDAKLWQPIEITRPWEKQDVGRAWKQKTGTDYDGWAWYSVKFKAAPHGAGRRLSLLFGAADEAATVYLNGREVGARPFTKPDDWKTPFSVDVTDTLKPNEENQLTVLVEDKSGQGGLWKAVWLVESKAAAAPNP